MMSPDQHYRMADEMLAELKDRLNDQLGQGMSAGEFEGVRQGLEISATLIGLHVALASVPEELAARL